VSETLGIFVAPAPTGNDSNAGTKSAPVATLKTALAKVGAKSFIFVCEGAYTESVDIKQSAAIFGGFKCSDWSYSATTLPKFTATKPDYVFHLDGANDTTIGDLELDAIDGAAGTGQSSVGMFVVNSQNVKVERMTIHAGKGADGPAGTLVNYTFPAQANGGNANVGFGGDGGTENCPNGSISTGGAGGDVGFDGKDGTPALDGGLHGEGGPSVGQGCTAGGNGANGLNGANGSGAATVGDLTDAGWASASGDDAGPGGPGQGGGGGGGQSSGGNSGGGGGGGAGACGGAGGGGGHGGGASIAVAAMNSTVNVSNTTCACGNAGAGGSGVGGQTGSTSPGAHGSPYLFGCIAGNGGNGGNGGGGGGGAGGSSIGIVSKGGSVKIDAFTQGHVTTGTPGAKGTGAAGNDGIPGIADASLTL
jgi:hypothetical protein